MQKASAGRLKVAKICRLETVACRYKDDCVRMTIVNTIEARTLKTITRVSIVQAELKARYLRDRVQFTENPVQFPEVPPENLAVQDYKLLRAVPAFSGN